MPRGSLRQQRLYSRSSAKMESHYGDIEEYRAQSWESESESVISPHGSKMVRF